MEVKVWDVVSEVSRLQYLLVMINVPSPRPTPGNNWPGMMESRPAYHSLFPNLPRSALFYYTEVGAFKKILEGSHA